MKQNKILNSVILFFFLTFIMAVHAQQESKYIQGDLIVQLKESFTDINKIIEKNSKYKNVETKLEAVEILSKSMNIWLFKFDASVVNHSDFVHHIGLNPNIIEFQNNYHVENRATPNDPEFDDQWQYINTGGSGGIVGADIDADLAWDITTGGTTPLGDEIVVCIVDDGILDVHEDLEANLWKNTQEIPNNGLDDDGNGYTDDYHGFDANFNGTGDLDDVFTNAGFWGVHGNAVAGVVGAKGNNGIGVTGINWDVKLMIVKNQGSSDAQVIKAYEYPLEMRKLYNSTDGAKGAFVVAVNSSWGIDNENPSGHAIWCNFYDEMGEAGIINTGATANANNNVDVVGDMPTGCSSDYLLTVTNIWRNDQKVTDAGYGSTTIDMGAFGRDAHTLSQYDTDGYEGFGGTSGATPQVAGAIALLYSAPCTSFANLYKTDPAAAALKAKEYVMNGADANTSLAGITVSGGRLNLNGMLSELDSECAICPVLDDYLVTSLTDGQANVQISLNGDTSQVSLYEVRYRVVGTTNWAVQSSSTDLVVIMGLEANTNYEYQVRFICDGNASSFSANKTFTTNFLSINVLAIENGIEVYPNPVKDIITIKLKELQENVEVYFYDISGKLIYESTMLTQKKKIDISVLSEGIYILKLKDETGKVYSHKVTKL